MNPPDEQPLPPHLDHLPEAGKQVMRDARKMWGWIYRPEAAAPPKTDDQKKERG